MCAQTSKASTTIKKYANRRLYNTATSSYVTLEDLAVMVKNGENFNVYDAKTSEDITRSVLTQIIVEEENKSGQQNLLPTNFLRQLIGFYGDNMQWMVPKYLENSMELLTGNQDKIRAYYENAFNGAFPFGSTLEEMGKQNVAMFENAMRLFTPFSFSALLGGEGEGEASSPTSSVSAPAPVPASTPAPDSVAPNAPTPSACSLSSGSPKKKGEEKEAASVTALKPHNDPTPMPSVASATAASSSGADDMQQKIANLQKQLADLAKSRA